MGEKGGEIKKDSLSRRGFLKLGLAVLGVAVGGKVLKEAGRSRFDITDPQNFREFSGTSELFDGFYPVYDGKVKLAEGTVIYNRPALFRSEEPSGGVLTTGPSASTEAGKIGAGEEITVSRPLLILIDGSDPNYTPDPVEVVGPGGVMKKVNLRKSWLVFSLDDPDVPDSISSNSSASVFRVGCTPLGNANLTFEGPSGGTILPSGLDITFETTITLGEVTRP